MSDSQPPLNSAESKADARVRPKASFADLFGPEEERVLEGRSILIVDDMEDGRRLLGRLLAREGATVEVLSGGRAALARFEQEDARFDLVLMDVEMPDLDGRLTVSALRDVGVTTPIVALTAHREPGQIDRCLAAGFDDVTPKPIEVESFAESCRRWIARG